MTCATAGDKRVQISRPALGGVTDTFYITVQAQTSCYEWYMAQVATNANGGSVFDDLCLLPSSFSFISSVRASAAAFTNRVLALHHFVSGTGAFLRNFCLANICG